MTTEIFHYWADFWNGNNVDHEAISRHLVEYAHQPVAPLSFDPPDLQLLIKTARARIAGGAASVGGWHGNEIKRLPGHALSVFRIFGFAVQWEQRQEIPVQLCYSRMVNLPKKTVDGKLDVQNIRPITILAGFWRLWASAYMQTPGVVAWVDSC